MGKSLIWFSNAFVGSGQDCKCKRTGQQIYSSHC